MEFIPATKKIAIIPLILLLIYLSIVPMQLSNYVLCIGADGHVEFEIAADGRCTDPHGLSKESSGSCLEPSRIKDRMGFVMESPFLLHSRLESSMFQQLHQYNPPFPLLLRTDQRLASHADTPLSPLETPLLVDPTL